MSETAIEPEVVSPLPATTGASHQLIPLKDKLLAFLNRSTSENTREAYRRTILEFHRFVGHHLLSAPSARCRPGAIRCCTTGSRTRP